MLKILVVLATTFVFAGLLIAHPYTSSSVELAGASAKVKPGPAPAPVTVAQAEPSSQPAKPTAQDAPVARPASVAQAAVRPAAPAKPAAQLGSQIVSAEIGNPANEAIAAIMLRPTAPVVVPAVRQPAHAAPAGGKRTDGRHWSQSDSQRMKADAARAQADAMPGQAVVANRPATTTRHVEYRRGY